MSPQSYKINTTLSCQDKLSVGTATIKHGPTLNQQCQTPKSKEHMIPEDRALCPPAPRKTLAKRRRRASLSQKKYFVPADLHSLPAFIQELFKS
eukprot:c19646_g1_i1 orf=1359-1640(+)